MIITEVWSSIPESSDGSVRKGDIIRLMNAGKNYEVTEVGVYAPSPTPTEQLRAGEVGLYLRQYKTGPGRKCRRYDYSCGSSGGRASAGI